MLLSIEETTGEMGGEIHVTMNASAGTWPGQSVDRSRCANAATIDPIEKTTDI